MRVRAPGKLLLTGAYAVLEGAPAIVVAVDRYAIADASRRTARASAEVRAALGDEPAPTVESEELYDGSSKMGLGSSAAVAVAALGACAAARGEDLTDSAVRQAIFRGAREAHARVQAGGSGVDVAASTYGGALRYALPNGGRNQELPDFRSVTLPPGLVMEVFWSGMSARTSVLRAQVDALLERDRLTYGLRMGALGEAAMSAAAAVDAGDVRAFIAAATKTAFGLEALGADAKAPIVPPSYAELARVAEGESAAFLPSGAGGGDVAVYLGTQKCSEGFLGRAYLFGMRPLAISVDRDGVRLETSVS